MKELVLPSDISVANKDLATYLKPSAQVDTASRELVRLVELIANGAVPLGHRLAMSTLPGDPAELVGVNGSGDRQKSLDVGAHDHMVSVLSRGSVQAILSEEAEDVIKVSPNGLYDVAIDPIDGSGSIGIGAPLGLLFAISPARSSFMHNGRDIVAAGYVSFGHSIDFGFSIGDGLTLATLDVESDVFRIKASKVIIPRDTNMIAYNVSNFRHWSKGLQRYIGNILEGQEGPRNKDFNMRWLAAAVGELHRILNQGGVFLYPEDRRPGFQKGHLRLLYEAFPIAWLIEQAGGAAMDGQVPILEKTPTHLHEKTPMIFGSKNEVGVIQSCIKPE